MKRIQTLTPKQEIIMENLADLPVMNTDQIGRAVFHENGSPSKRASEYLKELETLKLVEGLRRGVDIPKVWRLTKAGRDKQNVTRPPLAFNSMKLDHALAIADVYIDFMASGKAKKFLYELREEISQGKPYCPDGFIVYDGKPYLLEVQRSPLSGLRWGEKWAKTSKFFDGGHYKKATFQMWQGKIIRPRIIVVSDQTPEVIQAGSGLELIIRKNVQNLVI